MRLYYLDEREGAGCFVRAAVGVDAERWNDFFRDVIEWRLELHARYGIHPAAELQPLDPAPLGSGRG